MKLPFLSLALIASLATASAAPKLAGVSAAMQAAVNARQLSGAVTVVVTKDKILHVDATGLADIATNKPLRT